MKKEHYNNLEQAMTKAIQKYLPRIVQCGIDLLRNEHKTTASCLRLPSKTSETQCNFLMTITPKDLCPDCMRLFNRKSVLIWGKVERKKLQRKCLQCKYERWDKIT